MSVIHTIFRLYPHIKIQRRIPMKSWMITCIMLLVSIFFLFGCSEIIPNQVVLSYENEEGSIIVLDTVEKGDIIDTPNDPSQLGYQFIGWYYDKALENQVNWPLEMDDDTLIYPKYELVNYSINYILNGGENNSLNPQSFNVEMDNFQFLEVNKGIY